MARKYDRMIRFYDSWFADLRDPEKAFTAEERWQVIEAIVLCQEQDSTAALEELPLSIRRALSMATMREQLERVLERNQGARERGKKGAQERYARTNVAEPVPTLFDAQEAELIPPDDGIERNWSGLSEALRTFNVSNELTAQLAAWSNYGQIGHPIWKAISRIRTSNIKDKESYLTACLIKYSQ